MLPMVGGSGVTQTAMIATPMLLCRCAAVTLRMRIEGGVGAWREIWMSYAMSDTCMYRYGQLGVRCGERVTER